MNQALIIDVRSPQEFAGGHVKGAINVPHNRVLETIRNIEGLKETTPILVYCQSGVRAASVCAILNQHGFKSVTNCGSLTTLLMNYQSALAQAA